VGGRFAALAEAVSEVDAHIIALPTARLTTGADFKTCKIGLLSTKAFATQEAENTREEGARHLQPPVTRAAGTPLAYG
jgi:hypothetical protein